LRFLIFSAFFLKPIRPGRAAKAAKNQGARLFLSQPSSLRAQRSNLVLDFVFWSFGFVSDFVFRISSFSSPAAIKIKRAASGNPQPIQNSTLKTINMLCIFSTLNRLNQAAKASLAQKKF